MSYFPVRWIEWEEVIKPSCHKLKEYIDTYYLNSNRQLCREYGLDEAYFAPSMEYSKQEILDIIEQEAQQRAMNKSIIINDYRMLSARMVELCLKVNRGYNRVRESTTNHV